MKKIQLLYFCLIVQFCYSQNCFEFTAADIFGNTSVQLNCGAGSCIELTANYPKIYQSSSYQITSQIYNPVIPFDQGTALNINTDDTFSDVIPMPFSFCFYGNTYNKLVISPNGFVTFDTTEAKLESNPNIIADNPSTLLPKNSVFGVMQDLIFSNSDDSEIYYYVVGTAPCRKFVVNFYKGRITGCTDTFTSQIVFSEFTNEIEINIENKPFPCQTARFKESLLGIIDGKGEDGLSPPGRNRGIWQSGNESWKYSPNGAQIQPSIRWRNSSNANAGTTATINACPGKTEKYTVTATYSNCSSTVTMTDDIDVVYNQNGSAPTINSPVSFSSTLCDNNADNIENISWATLVTPLVTSDTTMNVRYYATQSAAESGGAGITNIRQGQYTIYARVTSQTGCYAIGIVNLDIKFYDKIEAKDIKKIFCFDGTEDVTVDLNLLYQDMLTTPISEITSVSFYLTQSDAMVPNLALAIPSTQIIADDKDVVIMPYFVRFENADGCYTVRKLTIELRNPTANQNQNICDLENDKSEMIVLSKLDGSIVGSQPVTASYFLDSKSAEENKNPITNFQLTGTNSPAIIFVRIDMEAENGDCFRIYPITLNLIESPVVTKQNITVSLGTICDNNNDNVEIYDLTKHESEIYSDPKRFSYSYFLGYNPSTHVFSNAIQYPNAFTIKNSTEVFVKVSEGSCFSMAKININFTFASAPFIKKGNLVTCDKGYDYGEIYNLHDANEDMFIASHNSEPLSNILVTYYATEKNANQDTLRINNLQKTEQNITTFWARFESKKSQCFSVAPIVLKTYFPPKAISSSIEVCDNNLDGNPEVNLLLPEYIKNMVSVSDPENNFKFYLTSNDITINNPIQNPEKFSSIPFPSKIYVVVENIAGCSDLASTIDFTVGTAISLTKDSVLLEKCDESNDGKETLDLTQLENVIYSNGASFSYYPTLKDLNDETNKITNPSAYSYDISKNQPVVFVKVGSSFYCPALATIDIKLKKTPIFEVPDYYFCPGVGIKIEPDLSFLNPKEYTWRNPAGDIISKDKYAENIKTAGKYSLTIGIENRCSYTEYFDVIAYEVPIITQLVGLSATYYQVIATGSQTILYSIDGIKWQTSNIFENIPPGPVIFHVKFESSKCLGEPKVGLSVDVPNAFTPNGDGKNDKWIFSNLDVYIDVSSTVKIYDKSGAPVFQQSSKDYFIWDGKLNGRSLPSSTYWYIMILPDKTINGWILLKNRN